jgi:transcriptional regulator with XRE-family HTH domain
MEKMGHESYRDLSLEVGRRLKKIRVEKGLTQKELAAKIQQGVDYTYIGRIERGQQLPSLKVLLRISEAFSLPIGYFFSETSETVVYLTPQDGLTNIGKHEKGGELFRAIELLHPHDMPLIVEIIRILARQRALDDSESASDSIPSSERLLLSAKGKSPTRKEKY